MSFTAVLGRLQKLENPYPGLRPFEKEEQHLFFGRDLQIAELVSRLERDRFVAVVGVSGSGKSSLVRAGLIPALERGSIGEVGVRWRTIVIRPAGAPFASLAAELSKNGLDPSALRQSSYGLVQVARQLPREETLLVVVDQFEELFRYKDHEALTDEARRVRETAASEASEFVQLLLAASRQQPPVYVVLTMRSDYLGDCAEFRDLPETLNTSQYLVPRLTREQRKEAIEGPLGHTAIAPNLVQRILNDAGDEPDQLPVLQHAIMRTWSQWRKTDPEQKRRIEIQDYEAIGGFENALNQHADELLSQVPEEIAAVIFKRLTARGRGDRERRDPATLAELETLCAADTPDQQARVIAVIDQFRHGEATFLAPRDGTLQPDTYIDITHESLIRLWKKLRDEWLPQETRSAKTFLYLLERATSWKAGKGEPLLGLDLTEAAEWDRQRNHTIAWASHYADEAALSTVLEFIAASQAREKKRTSRAKRNLWIAAALAALFAGLAVVAGYEWYRAKMGELDAGMAQREAEQQRHLAEVGRQRAVQSQNDAEQERTNAWLAQKNAEESQQLAEQESETAQKQGAIALSRQLGSQAQLLQRQVHLEPATLLATEAMERVPVFEADLPLRELLSVLPRQIARLAQEDYVYAVAFSPNGRYVATGSADKTARVFDVSRRKEISRLTHEGVVTAVAFSPDGRYVATASEDNTSRVFETASGKEAARLAHDDSVNCVAFSPDGRYVATGSADKTARVFEAATGNEMSRITHGDMKTPGGVNAVAFSPDGRYVATGSVDGTARVFEATSGKEVARLNYNGSASAVAFSPDGRYVAIGSADGIAWVFETFTGNVVWRITHQGPVSAVAFGPGNYLATGSDDRIARVFSLEFEQEMSRLTHQGPVKAVAFSPDGRYVATASEDGSARVFESATGREVARLTHERTVYAVAFSRDGRYVATASEDKTARVFEPFAERELLQLPAARAVAFTPDGRYLVAARKDNTVRIFTTADGHEVGLIHQDVRDVTFSPDGRYVAATGWDKTARVFEAASGREVARFTHQDSVNAVAFSPNSRYVATGSADKAARIFELASGREVANFDHSVAVRAVVFSPDGRYLATGSADKTARVFDVSRRKEISRLTHEREVIAVAFSPDGRYVATGSVDNTSRVFETASGKEISRLTHLEPVETVSLSPDGRYVATGSQDNIARVFEAATGREVSRIPLSGWVRASVYTDRGRYLLTASQDPWNELIVTRNLLRPQDLIDEACSRLTRNLTREEWRQYVGADVPYHKTCPNLP